MSTAQQKARHAQIVSWVEECLEPLGTVTARAMMGGQTLYCGGVVFAIVGGGELWFKADGETDHEWDSAGRERFTYDRNGTPAAMNYRLAPDDVYDYPEEMMRWAELALVAGRSAQARKKPKKKED